MTLDLDAIKQLAEAATVCKQSWWEETVLAQALSMGDEPWDADYAYMAAMSPTVALDLIYERDRWKERWKATVQDASEHRATVQRVRELCLAETAPDRELVQGAWFAVLDALEKK